MTEIVTQPSIPQGFPEELVASGLFLLKRLGMAAKEDSLEAYEATGLHPYHHAILAVLDKGQQETQGAIGHALGYDKSQLVGLVDELEEAGLIERRRDPLDRRRHVVHITPAGRKMLTRLRRLSETVENEFMSSLGDDERRQLHDLLFKLAQDHLPNCRFVEKPAQS